MIDWREVWNKRGHDDEFAATGGRDQVSFARTTEQVRHVMRFDGRDTVLDIGCARGGLLERIAADVAFGVGADFSFTMLPAGGQLGAKCSFVQADALALPFRDGSFTKLTAISVVPYVPDALLEHFLCECRRVLAEGGQAFVSHFISRKKARGILSFRGFTPPGSLSQVWRIVRKKVAFAVGALTTHDLEEVLAISDKLGFEATKVTALAVDSIYRDDSYHFTLLLKRRPSDLSGTGKTVVEGYQRSQ